MSRRARWRDRRRVYTRRRRSGLRARLTRSFALVALLAVLFTSWITVSSAFQVLGQVTSPAGSPLTGPLGGEAGAAWWQSLDESTREAFRNAAREGGRAILRGAALSAGLSALLAALVAAFVTRQLTRPLVRLADGARLLERGERGVRLPVPPRDDELRDLTLTFNSFVESLERQEAWRRALVADVAHDLRTPLAVMRAEIEAMQDGLSAPDEGGLSRLHGEVLLLARLVDDLRTLSLAEGGALSLHPVKLDLNEILRGVAENYRPRAERAGARLHLTLPASSLPLVADPDRLIQVLHNLLDNALAYAGGDIELGAAAGLGEEVTLWVRDHGPGLSAEALSKAFERFYRADAARGRDAAGRAGLERAGSGLGLSIARALVEAQGGHIEAGNHAEGGALFTLRFAAE